MISFVFDIWTWYLWVDGTMHAHMLPREKAMIAVAVAIVLQWFVMLLWWGLAVTSAQSLVQ
jgi:hypothetical protein